MIQEACADCREWPCSCGTFKGPGWHACIRCRLAMIPDSEPRVLCAFCRRTDELERER